MLITGTEQKIGAPKSFGRWKAYPFMFFAGLWLLASCGGEIEGDDFDQSSGEEIFNTYGFSDSSSFLDLWEPVWSDEFNTGGTRFPNSSKWEHEVGKLRNNEVQYYTNDRPLDQANAYVKGGNLIIEARRENYKGSTFTSASLKTKGKYEFTYGRVEVRAKVPAGTGVWPAIWTLGTNQNDIVDGRHMEANRTHGWQIRATWPDRDAAWQSFDLVPIIRASGD